MDYDDDENEEHQWSSTEPLLGVSTSQKPSITSSVLSRMLKSHDETMEERERQYLDSIELESITLGNLDGVTHADDSHNDENEQLLAVPHEIKESELLDAELQETLD